MTAHHDPQSQAAEIPLHNSLLLLSILESAPLGICLLGPDGTVRLINPAGRRLLEAGETGTILNRSILPVLAVEDRAAFVEFIVQVLGGASGQREVGLPGADGTVRRLEVDAVPLRDPQGNVTDLLGFLRDATKLGPAEPTSQADGTPGTTARAQDHGSDREDVGALVSGIAHDLNNVLGPITMSLNILKTKLHDPDSRELLEIIETCAVRGSGLARRILSPERGVGGHLPGAPVEPGAGGPAAPPRGRGETVLVIDDEPAVRQITKQTLEGHGYRAVVAADGTEAVTLFVQRHTEIALVLTDMTMPGMDGMATIQVLRRIAPHVKLVAASGLSTRDSLARLNVVHFLAKPYTTHALLTVLAEALQDRRLDVGASRDGGGRAVSGLCAGVSERRDVPLPGGG